MELVLRLNNPLSVIPVLCTSKLKATHMEGILKNNARGCFDTNEEIGFLRMSSRSLVPQKIHQPLLYSTVLYEYYRAVLASYR
jgi:hypothetical protein